MSSGGIFQAATHAAMGRYRSAWERCKGGARRAGGMCELVAMLLTAFWCSPETLQRHLIFISCGRITYLFHTTCVFCLLIFPYNRKDLHADLHAISHEFVSSMVPPSTHQRCPWLRGTESADQGPTTGTTAVSKPIPLQTI